MKAVHLLISSVIGARLADILLSYGVFLRVGGDVFNRVESNGLGMRLFVGGDLLAVPWMFLSIFLLVGAFLLVRYTQKDLGSLTKIVEGVIMVGCVIATAGYIWGVWTAIRFLVGVL